MIDGNFMEQPSLNYLHIDSCGFFARKKNNKAVVQTAAEPGTCHAARELPPVPLELQAFVCPQKFLILGKINSLPDEGEDRDSARV